MTSTFRQVDPPSVRRSSAPSCSPGLDTTSARSWTICPASRRRRRSRSSTASKAVLDRRSSPWRRILRSRRSSRDAKQAYTGTGEGQRWLLQCSSSLGCSRLWAAEGRDRGRLQRPGTKFPSERRRDRGDDLELHPVHWRDRLVTDLNTSEKSSSADRWARRSSECLRATRRLGSHFIETGSGTGAGSLQDALERLCPQRTSTDIVTAVWSRQRPRQPVRPSRHAGQLMDGLLGMWQSVACRPKRRQPNTSGAVWLRCWVDTGGADVPIT